MMIIKKALLVSLGIFFTCSIFAQVSLTPSKLIIFEDAAQLNLKGILRFTDKRAQIIPDFEFDPATLSIREAGEYNIVYMKFIEDTVLISSTVSNWVDVLDANRGKFVTVVYEIGSEFDEVTGEVRMMDRNGGIFMLRKSGGGDFFIPINQVRQVIVESTGIYTLEKKTTRKLLEVEVDKEMPFAPVELTGILTQVKWTPVCRIKVIGEKFAEYKVTGLIENNGGLIQEVETELSSSNILTNSSSGSGDVFKPGKLALKPGEKLFMDLATTKYECQFQFTANIPWVNIMPSSRAEPATVRNMLKFSSPLSAVAGCNQISIINESGHLLGYHVVAPGENAGILEIALGEDPRVKVSMQESVAKPTGKKIKIGEKTYDQYRVIGKISVVSSTSELVSVKINREILGEFKEGEKAIVTDSNNANAKILTWTTVVKSGQNKEIDYQYDALISSGQ